jgi:hypothetical protein
VVCNGEGVHVQFPGPLDEVVYAAQTIQEGVLAVNVEMGELGHCVDLSEARTPGRAVGPIIAQKAWRRRLYWGAGTRF